MELYWICELWVLYRRSCSQCNSNFQWGSTQRTDIHSYFFYIHNRFKRFKNNVHLHSAATPNNSSYIYRRWTSKLKKQTSNADIGTFELKTDYFKSDPSSKRLRSVFNVKRKIHEHYKFTWSKYREIKLMEILAKQMLVKRNVCILVIFVA